MRFIFIFALLALLTACSQPRAPRIKTTRPLTAEEARIVEIARQAVATNDAWVERAEFHPPRRQPEGGWSVMVWRLPATPGGFRIVTINDSGKVTDYVRGH
jgi:hypothetical protein